MVTVEYGSRQQGLEVQRNVTSSVRELDLDRVWDDAANSPRLALSKKRVKEFAVIIKERGAAAFPPVVVAGPRSDGSYVLVDGRHRVAAARRAGVRSFPAEIRAWEGERELFVEALRLSARAGLPLTNPEKRLAVCRLLREFPEASTREVAELAGTSHNLVAVCRRQGSRSVAPLKKPRRRPPLQFYADRFLQAYEALRAAPRATPDSRDPWIALAEAAHRRYRGDAFREIATLRQWLVATQSSIPVGTEGEDDL